MATQPTALRSRNHRSTLVLLVLATLLTTLGIGGLLLGLPAPVSVPATPVVAPVVPGDPPLASRLFADEIAGAGALDLTAAASGMQPDWAPAQQPAVAPITAAPAPRAASRLFADEIAAGAGIADWTLPDVPAIIPQHGPR